MELRITDPTQTLDADFGIWLLPKVTVKLLSQVSQYNLKHIDEYLNTSESLTRLYKRHYTSVEIIEFAAKHLVSESINGNISIKVSDTLFVPGFDRFRVDLAAKLINFGTIDLKPVPIFTNVFSYFAKNIDTFIDFYYHEVKSLKERQDVCKTL